MVFLKNSSSAELEIEIFFWIFSFSRSFNGLNFCEILIVGYVCVQY